MKSSFLQLCISISLLLLSNASYSETMGGHITWQFPHKDTIEVFVTVYTPCTSSVALETNLQIIICKSTTPPSNFTLKEIRKYDITGNHPSIGNTCDKKGSYIDQGEIATVLSTKISLSKLLGTTKCTSFKISYGGNTRKLTNLSAYNYNKLYLQSSVNIDPYCGVVNPQFVFNPYNIKPADKNCHNGMLSLYSESYRDSVGRNLDSLSYYAATPLCVPTLPTGYTCNPFVKGKPIDYSFWGKVGRCTQNNMDSVTGNYQVKMSSVYPDYTVANSVHLWRKSNRLGPVLLGIVTQEMDFYFDYKDSTSNTDPEINCGNANSKNRIFIPAGDSLCFSIIASDTTTDSVFMNVPVIPPGSKLSYSRAKANLLIADICYHPNDSMYGGYAEPIYVEAKDDHKKMLGVSQEKYLVTITPYLKINPKITDLHCGKYRFEANDKGNNGITTKYQWKVNGALVSASDSFSQKLSSGRNTVELICFNGTTRTYYDTLYYFPIAANIRISKPVICAGQPDTLEVKVSNAKYPLVFRWSHLSLGNFAKVVVHPDSSETYSVQIMDSFGCPGIALAKITVPEITVKFSASPLNGFAPLSILFTDSSVGNNRKATYFFGDSSQPYITTQKSASHIYKKPGIYSVKLKITDTFNNCSDSLLKANYITANITGIESINNKSGFYIYPNPAGEYINITNKEVKEPVLLKIIGADGKEIQTYAQKITGKQNQVNIQSLPPGIYFMEFYSTHHNSLLSVIKFSKM